MPKATLRKEMLQQRRLFASTEKSERICEKALLLPAVQNAKNVMVYLPSKGEVDTALLIALLLREGKNVSAPRVISDIEMEAAFIDANGFRKGAFGIWEPLGKRAEQIDVIFVPGVAFDEKRNRIGYGKGYYDRFLSLHPALTVGLAYSFQLVPALPTEAHDKPLDIILTEEAVYA